MPKKPTGRATDAEQRLVEAVRNLRKRRSWSYDELAKRMTNAGCKIHATGIYKTENEGRRVTIEELVTYASVFETTPESLLQYGGKRQPRTLEMWRDLMAAEKIFGVLRTAQNAYHDLIRGVHNELIRNHELRDEIQRKFDADVTWQSSKLQEDAEQMRIDISTTEKFDEALWTWMSTARMVTFRDALKGKIDD